MKRRVLWWFAIYLAGCGAALAQPPAPAQAPAALPAALPSTVTDVFTRAGVPMDSVAIIIKEAGAPEPLISINPNKPMNSASVMKLVTTYAGLELLGPGYTWKTEVYTSGELKGNVLTGDLILKGGGDPKLTAERLGLMVKLLRERGLRSIHGDLTLDKSFFDAGAFDPARFDGEPLKAYNVGADPLLLSFKTVRFHFAPTLNEKSVVIVPDTRPAQLEVVNRMKLVDGPCGDWRDHIVLDVQAVSAIQLKVAFSGRYPKSCGEAAWSLSLLDHARYLGGVFASQWKDAGGIWTGAVKMAPVPPDAKLVSTIESQTLAEMVRDINKFSNNVMARQLFLTLSAEGYNGGAYDLVRTPGSIERSTQLVKDWLNRKGIAAADLVMENGSGLSRRERISAQTLAGVLDSAWRSNVMPEFIASMSLLGIDGTFRRRARGDSIAGQAHLKSGTLNDVNALAGYVQDPGGKRWIVVMLVNHVNAGGVQAAQDALLQWVFQQR
jgi:D-alanyl-D-alanine carboxypeptidase/D-alanyl-D-alanine-endopeptidase (penicillin-binding protein 4)